MAKARKRPAPPTDSELAPGEGAASAALPGVLDKARLRALKGLAKRLGVVWREELADPLHQALTHASYSKEHPGTGDNERLELLGDAVATLVVLQVLFYEHPHEDEGELSSRRHAMVSRKVFGRIGRDLGLGPLLVVGEGARTGRISENDNVLGGALEAILGALSLVLPWDEVRLAVVRGVVEPSMRIVASGEFNDFKTLLQHECHARGWPEPAYRVVAETGPRHAPTIEVEVALVGGVTHCASAKRRREAEQLAARGALDALRIAETGPPS